MRNKFRFKTDIIQSKGKRMKWRGKFLLKKRTKTNLDIGPIELSKQSQTKALIPLGIYQTRDALERTENKGHTYMNVLHKKDNRLPIIPFQINILLKRRPAHSRPHSNQTLMKINRANILQIGPNNHAQTQSGNKTKKSSMNRRSKNSKDSIRKFTQNGRRKNT